MDSRNYIFNNYIKSFKNRKTNSTKKNSVLNKSKSKSNSIYNISKSRSKSNKKNNSKNILFDSNNSKLFNQKTKIKNANNKNFQQISKKNIMKKNNWKIDSRNKRALFVGKNSFKGNTKNIF